MVENSRELCGNQVMRHLTMRSWQRNACCPFCMVIVHLALGFHWQGFCFSWFRISARNMSLGSTLKRVDLLPLRFQSVEVSILPKSPGTCTRSKTLKLMSYQWGRLQYPGGCLTLYWAHFSANALVDQARILILLSSRPIEYACIKMTLEFFWIVIFSESSEWGNF